MKKEFLQPEYLPTHIGIIMDGNGRWAQKRGLPRTAGHKKGADVFGEISRYCRDIGIRYLTVYAFSTENWKRPQSEVKQLMDLLKQSLRDTEKYRNENIRLVFLGDRTLLDDEMRELMRKAEDGSRDNTALTVCMAINYGGRDEITHAVRRIVGDALAGTVKQEDVTEKLFETYLYTAGIPDPDVIIRPSGEKRNSNFLAWQSAYSEYVFMDILWPDFTTKNMDQALEEYSKRARRFGGVC